LVYASGSPSLISPGLPPPFFHPKPLPPSLSSLSSLFRLHRRLLFLPDLGAVGRAGVQLPPGDPQRHRALHRGRAHRHAGERGFFLVTFQKGEKTNQDPAPYDVFDSCKYDSYLKTIVLSSPSYPIPTPLNLPRWSCPSRWRWGPPPSPSTR
jgi:hypothetical protein